MPTVERSRRAAETQATLSVPAAQPPGRRVIASLASFPQPSLRARTEWVEGCPTQWPVSPARWCQGQATLCGLDPLTREDMGKGHMVTARPGEAWVIAVTPH